MLRFALKVHARKLKQAHGDRCAARLNSWDFKLKFLSHLVKNFQTRIHHLNATRPKSSTPPAPFSRRDRTGQKISRKCIVVRGFKDLTCKIINVHARPRTVSKIKLPSTPAASTRFVVGLRPLAARIVPGFLPFSEDAIKVSIRMPDHQGV